jgi:two-component system cell cycle sensor histidine kinase/response regulator CckA
MAEMEAWHRPRRSDPLRRAFARLFAAVPEGLALLNAEGRILQANAGLARMAGPAVPLRPGLPAAALLAPESREILAGHLAAALAGGADPAPFPATPADPAAPEDAEWAVQCHLLPPEAGEAPMLLLRVADRTEQRRAAARSASAARLETIGRLAGGIAHDFNNLLAAVLGSVEAIRAACPEVATEELCTIEDAAQRGAALVRQLLAFARQQRLRPRVLDLNAAVRGIAPLLRRLLGNGIAVELALEEPGRKVLADPVQFDQVLLNLAANAREAMPEGGTLRIATGHRVVLRPEGEGAAALPPGRYAVLEVSDTGTGIPAEALPRLFEPFFTTRPERGGTGLGLATVQGIVAQSGGHIAVETRPGKGTTFRIHLPRHEGAPPETAPAAPAPPDAAGERSAKEAAILLVEDEAPLRRLAERLLRRAGYAVAAAPSAEAALDLVVERPAALVSDIAMPGADGVTLARALRARWPGLPVLLLSGYAGAAGREAEAEGFRLLAKPFAPGDLLQAVAALLARPAEAAA